MKILIMSYCYEENDSKDEGLGLKSNLDFMKSKDSNEMGRQRLLNRTEISNYPQSNE